MPLGLAADSIFFGCLGAAGAEEETGAGAGDLEVDTGCPKLFTTKLLIFNGAFLTGALVVVVGAFVVVVVVGAFVVVVGAGVVVVGAGAAVVVGFSSTTAAGRTTPFALMSTIFSTVGAAVVVTGATGFSVRISTNLTGASS